MDKIIDRRDLDFVLYDLLQVEELTRYPRFAEHSRQTFASAIGTALAIAEQKFAPCNRKCDANEPHFDGERVHVIPEVKEAIDAFAQAGFIAAMYDEAQGGMQLPYCVTLACYAIFRGANVAVDAYATLTAGAADLIHEFGSPEQKARYLAPMLTGRYFGTMVLTEPQAGSSLADVETSATPRPDGTYAIKGNKIFISGGDHELSDNIVHMVLARIPGAPPGVKGISLFIVPKYRVDSEGRLGAKNDVALAGLIHKMGYRGTTSTMLNFGENDGCAGELVGEPHRGLTYMFQMMNAARVGVGLGAAMLGYTGYLHALDYARERLQGRSGKDPHAPPVPIIRHADVRRMLLAQKAYVEGALALCLYAGLLVDRQKYAATDEERREARLLLDLLTPIVKTWPSRYGVEANSLAIQVHGGYGYTREYAVEQFFRDNRLNEIHEGTSGIQALDLLGRKVIAENGAPLRLFGRALAETVLAARGCEDAELAQHAAHLSDAWERLVETTRVLGGAMAKNPELGLANASVYLDMFGHTVMAWIWLKQALVAWPKRSADGAEGDFYRGKLGAARYFFHWELPKTGPQHTLLRSLDTSCLEMQEGWF
ncbi:acyl-CoA dehydrogenase [Pendulispora albinea]|uniref:Acyl-CoA dehydrogenase n=1 Tax=Pendulispora albinea TaxID=2741071 RepID=A0ABZ2M7T8_9BACT